MKKLKKLRLFALDATKEFGQEVAKHLGISLSEHKERCFADDECYVAPSPELKENMRGKDVFVIQSVYSDEKENINTKLMKLFIFLGALHDAAAKRVTVVLPYYPYARQDRKTTSRAPITTKYLARMFKTVWAKRVLALDVHSPTALQNGYPIPIDLLEARNLFANYCRRLIAMHKTEEIVVLSPDVGGLDRTRKFRNVLEKVAPCKVAPMVACMDKEHSGDEIRGYNIISSDPIIGKSVVIYDDMISSGSTTLEAIKACKRSEAKEVLAACAAHGLFVGKADEYLDHPFLKHIAVCDTIRPFRVTNPAVRDKLNIISTTELFAEAIRRTHKNESISDLIANHLL